MRCYPGSSNTTTSLLRIERSHPSAVRRNVEFCPRCTLTTKTDPIEGRWSVSSRALWTPMSPEAKKRVLLNRVRPGMRRTKSWPRLRNGKSDHRFLSMLTDPCFIWRAAGACLWSLWGWTGDPFVSVRMSLSVCPSFCFCLFLPLYFSLSASLCLCLYLPRFVSLAKRATEKKTEVVGRPAKKPTSPLDFRSSPDS